MFIFPEFTNSSQNPGVLQEKSTNIIYPKEERKKPRRCRFQEIPIPLKYSHNSIIYPIYGDMAFIEHEGKLATDVSLFNEFKFVQEVVSSELYGQRTIALKLTQKVDKDLPTWMEFVDYLSKSDKPEISEWSNLIKQFCQTYSKVMQRQSRKKMKSEPRKKFFAEVTLKTEQQKKILFNMYPCLQLKFRLKNHHNQLREIIYSENIITELGYSCDSFISTVLSEGIPQLMPYNNPLVNSVLKPLIENYFTIADAGNEVPDLESMIFYRDNFVRNVKFKIFCFMNYEINTFGMDIILAITAIGEPYLCPKNISKQRLDPVFLENMVVREDQSDYLLSSYYEETIKRKYTGISETCLVRELTVDKNIILKGCDE